MNAVLVVLFIVTWLVGGAIAAVYVTDEAEGAVPFGALTGPLFIIIAIVSLVYRGTTYALGAPQRRRARIEADYQETLRLVDWKPRPVTRIQELQEALEVEHLLGGED